MHWNDHISYGQRSVLPFTGCCLQACPTLGSLLYTVELDPVKGPPRPPCGFVAGRSGSSGKFKQLKWFLLFWFGGGSCFVACFCRLVAEVVLQNRAHCIDRQGLRVICVCCSFLLLLLSKHLCKHKMCVETAASTVTQTVSSSLFTGVAMLGSTCMRTDRV